MQKQTPKRRTQSTIQTRIAATASKPVIHSHRPCPPVTICVYRQRTKQQGTEIPQTRFCERESQKEQHRANYTKSRRFVWCIGRPLQGVNLSRIIQNATFCKCARTYKAKRVTGARLVGGAGTGYNYPPCLYLTMTRCRRARRCTVMWALHRRSGTGYRRRNFRALHRAPFI